MPSTLTALTMAALSATAMVTTSYSNFTNATNSYSLVADYTGSSFFSHFDAFTGPDPTNGFVNYTDMAFAANKKLVGFATPKGTNATHAYIGVDFTTPNVAAPGRNAVRLSSKDTFSAGMLAIMDVHHMPVGYGTWPAAWFLGTGATWPAVGEIDVIENTHVNDFNAMTLHTSSGCTVDNATSQNFLGNLQDCNCNSGNAANGCSTQAPPLSDSYGQQVASAGHPFNAQGGAVYVTEWTASGIKVWAFSRDAVPASLNSASPSTSGLPTPLAHFSGSGCDFETKFDNMTMIINTALCGDWAGKTWESSGSAAATGVATCDAYVAAHPEAFEDAHWEIGGVKIYASTPQPGVQKRSLPSARLGRRWRA
jgi:hypothetical protein